VKWSEVERSWSPGSQTEGGRERGSTYYTLPRKKEGKGYGKGLVTSASITCKKVICEPPQTYFFLIKKKESNKKSPLKTGGLIVKLG
jgi:hypothetical protein